MKKSNLLGKALIVGLLFIFFSCDKEEYVNEDSGSSGAASQTTKESSSDNVIYGPETPLGNGFAKSWVRMNNYQIPLEIGIEMSSGVLNDLPENGDFSKSVIITLPKIATEITAFNHIGINWIPERFSDIESFKKGHFDFHFYTISLAERMQIPEWSEELDSKFSTYPQKNYMPVDYAPLLKGVGSYAQTGRYWLPGNSDNYLPFAHTLALGTFNGKFVFISPIVTLEFLKSGKVVNSSFSQPLNYPINQLFPREYNIYIAKNGNYTVSLGNFIHR